MKFSPVLSNLKAFIMGRWITSIIFLLLIGELSSFGINLNHGLKYCTATKVPKPSRTERSKRASGDGYDNPDPNIALEGQCIVVCDADVVGLKPSTPGNSGAAASNQFYQDDSPKDADENSRPDPVSGTASNLWNKIAAPGCGGLVGTGRRDRRIAFSVKRSTELTVPTTARNGRATVTFDHVMVNVGNAFDMESSNFVAPVSGVYSLYFQVYRLYNKSPLTIDLLVNEFPALRGFADGEGDNHNSAHNNGILHLRARDRVELQVIGGNLESGWKYSTFSGFLIFEDQDL